MLPGNKSSNRQPGKKFEDGINKKDMNKLRYTLLIICFSGFGLYTKAQTHLIKPDLSAQYKFSVLNRELTVSVIEHQIAVVHLNAKPNDGVAWIGDVNFQTGILEFDVKGKNVLQQSFVGIAFCGINDSTFDVIYFRPFNFQSKDTIRKSHSVQYVSLPKYDWFALRQTYPGKYENALISTVDPEKWFHARIIVEAAYIAVYVNDDKEPSLKIKPITNLAPGKIGFWVGNNSDGNFKNLSIIKK